MRPAKGALKAGPADKHSLAFWAILELPMRNRDKHATPWDEPERDWGKRGGGPVRIFRKAFRREKLLGTW